MNKPSNDFKYNKIKEIEEAFYSLVFFEVHYDNSNLHISKRNKLAKLRTWQLANKVYNIAIKELEQEDYHFSMACMHWRKVFDLVNCIGENKGDKPKFVARFIEEYWEDYEYTNS